MKLIHYTDEEFTLEPRAYEQAALRTQGKPNGLWFSVEGPDDWKEFCESGNWNLHDLVVSYELHLKEGSNILHLKTAEEIMEFGKTYPLSTRRWDPEHDTYHLNWTKVREKYQGIIISPYQWDCTLAIETAWYYGWDCSSGCIWDLEAIKELKLIERETK
jgi:hypothetical protein